MAGRSRAKDAGLALLLPLLQLTLALAWDDGEVWIDWLLRRRRRVGQPGESCRCVLAATEGVRVRVLRFDLHADTLSLGQRAWRAVLGEGVETLCVFRSLASVELRLSKRLGAGRRGCDRGRLGVIHVSMSHRTTSFLQENQKRESHETGTL